MPWIHLLVHAYFLLNYGLCWAGITGREFVNVFPQDGDPGSDVQREVTIAAASSAGSTAVTVLVYNTSFRQELSLAGGQIRTLSLPAQVDMPGSYSPNAFLVQADQEVSVLALRCRPGSCAASPLYPVGFWGNHYYAMAPLVPGQASLAEIVITNHASDNLVDIVLAGPVSFQGRAYSRGDVLTLHLGPFWSAQLQSPQSLSGSEITSQKAVGVVCGYTCAPEGGQGCSYGFVQLLPTSGWGDTYVVPPLPTQSSSSSSSSSDLLYVFTYLTTQLRVQDNQAQHERTLLGGAVEELPVNPSSAAYITASRGVQVVYFRSGAAGPFLMGLLSADRSCLGFGLVARPGFQTHAVVVARGSSGIQLRYDGVPLPPGVSWHSVAGVDQSWGLLPIGSPGQHSLQQLDGQFGVYVIGTSPTSSYSYPGLCSGTARDPCQVVRCGYSRQCVVKAGVPVCVSTAGLCQAWGDPHYLTFDGTAFDFQGGCTYTISQTSCRGAPPLPSGFAVQATNENRGDARVSFVRKVHVTLPGVNITIVRGEEPQVRVNGSKHYLPIRLQAGALALYHSGFSAVLETAGGLLLRFDWLHHLQLELRRGLLGAVCGLCGNFNDDPSDDLLTPDGRRALGEEDFGRSWAVAGSAGGNGGCRHDCGGGPCPRCSTEQLSRFGSGSSCGLLEDPLGPFAPCRSAVDPAPYIRGCVYELCVFEGGSELLCRALKTYADACQWAGIQVSSWRGLAHCPLTCPVNSHYEPCGSACPATCSDPDAPAQCQAACVEMCQCDVGFLLSGGGCVLPKQCGCTYQGFYYLPGQQFWADNRCQELCTCDPSAHQVRCVPAQCQPDELCHSVGGELGCHPVQLGVCSVEGDPHYTTFDGRRYDFEGSCVYQLAASCPGSLGLEPFEVRIQNEQGGPMGAASSKTVLILVHGYQIEITREHKSRVLVNGILIDLPSLLSGGEVKVYRRGLAATVETDFGFILTYDWNNHVTLAVNRTYSGFLCGLCGNYNDNPADDLATSSGQLTSDPTAFGRSWRTSQVPGCQDTRPQGQPACGEAQRAALLGRSSCGMLTDALGPFRECHRAVDPDRFFQNCLSDVCLSQGRQAVLCQFLASYVGQCQEAGANIYHWRSSGFCELSCPANSRYVLCSTSPLASCIQSPGPVGITCREDCRCLFGFVRSGDQCIPSSHCGCLHEGVYYQSGDRFFPDPQCTQFCTCSAGNQVQCQPTSCPQGEQCTMREGTRGCYPLAALDSGVVIQNPIRHHSGCSVAGGLHYRSFDGRAFNLWGNCTYTLARSCPGSGPGVPVEPFSVRVQHERVELEIYGMTFALLKGRAGEVQVDGVTWTIPAVLDWVSAVQHGLQVRVETRAGLVLLYDLQYFLLVSLPGSYGGQVCGLCGDFNGSPEDDLRLPDGRLTSDPQELGAAWTVPALGASCLKGCGEVCPRCDPGAASQFGSERSCGMIAAPGGPFAACVPVVDPQPFLSSCVYDLCVSEGSLAQLCRSLEAYAATCQDAGVDILPWRSPELCSPTCPPGSQYQVCAKTCPLSCAGALEGRCPQTCAEGCECAPGLRFNGEGCVALDKCGCFHNGRYYKPGEATWVERCTKRCTCTPPAGLSCVPAACAEGLDCRVAEGALGCFMAWHCPENSHYEPCGSACPATCSDPEAPARCQAACVETCQCDVGFLLSGGECVAPSQCGCTHDGFYYPANETFWADEECHEQCTCDPHTSRVTCRQASCGLLETCQLVGGVRRCQPLGVKSCSSEGGLHFVTFDGLSYDFQGGCVYQLVGLCSGDPSLTPFTVWIQRGRGVSPAVMLTVNVYGITMEIGANSDGRIQVDGLFKSLPYFMHADKVVTYSTGLYVVVRTAFGLSLTLDSTSHVALAVPSVYSGTLCGLCGNYNANSTDDLTGQDGQLAESTDGFGRSWRVGGDPDCADGCKGGVCLGCPELQKELYMGGDSCAMLTDPSGPFRECHSTVDAHRSFNNCVGEVCSSGGLQSVLCQSLARYVSACQEAGVHISPWRNSTFCDLLCPAGSHYSLCSDAVPPSCVSVPPPVPALSSSPCREDCQCDPGLLRSGGACVPPQQCGCFHDGGYLLSGETYYTDFCQQLCTCQLGGVLQCQAASCSSGEECRVKDGVLGCHLPALHGRCSVLGGMHYHTFDGRDFDFRGNCTYTLARRIPKWGAGGGLASFFVRVQNEQQEGSAVWLTNRVELEVSGQNFSLSQEHAGKVEVDGVLENLPFSRPGVRVYRRGLGVVIHAQGLVKVTFDLQYHVALMIPDGHRDQLCGLCGNFNGNPRDDLQLPDGRLTEDPQELGASWRAPVLGEDCSDGCGGACPHCDPQVAASRVQEESYCWLTMAPSGPFAACSPVVDPQSFFGACMYDLCLAQAGRAPLCASLQAYAAACQEAGVTILPWRTSALCPLRCPEFSHYSLCADACAAACAEARPALDCPANCTEACACDSGYVFDGNACVSADQCGCLQDGRRYKPGEDTLVESCSLNCTCVPPSLLCEPYSCPEPLTCQAWDGVLSCHEPGPCTAKCHSTEICVMRNGVPVCEGPAPASCWAWGDPHYHSFDGWDFDFQGTCTYILAASNGSASGLEPFTVTEKNENRGNAAVSFLRVVHVAAYGHTLSLHRRESGKVRVNGAIANLPISLLGGKLTVRMLGTSAVLATDFGLRVLYNWDAFLLVSLPGSYRRHVGGLCGNFNGDPGDDQPALAGAESWRVSDGDPHCCTRCQADCQACGQEEEALYSNDSHCGAITEAAGIFSACHATVDPRPFFRGCLHDLCQHGGARPILCQALDAYGMACGHVGAVSVDWSAQAGCSLSAVSADWLPTDCTGSIDGSDASPCPEHSSYTTCGTACPRSCTHKLQNMMCIMLCVAGCFCDKGYLQSPLGCVREDQCGCIYNGQYYNPGEVFWTPVDCRQRCTCVPSTGVVRCQNSSCGAQEQCSLNVGVWGCHPTGHFNCTVQAGRHFLTFDRRAYDFRGSCSYWLVRICSWNSQLVPFEIRLSEGSCGNRLYNDMDLSIKVYKTLISISKASPLKVQVNGSQVFLPFSWNSQVVIYPSPWSVMVETDFGLRVVLYQSGTWLVFLPSTYGSVVCGLCGNANGNPSDDFLMPTGQLAASAQEFGSSWQMDRVPGCETVCSSGTRQCSVEEQQLFRRELYCGVLLNDMGPFGQCTRILDPQPYLRSCIADTCAYGGHHSALCSSIAAYVAACQAAEIPVRQWRRDTFCGAVCPDNSHYELCGTSCPVTCYELAAPVYCSAPCREGCQCNSGFVLSNGRCIPISECGCLYQGQYYPQGVFYPEAGCHLRCQCSMGGRVQCFRCGCGPQEQCQEEGGVRKCVPASYGMCLVLAGIGYVTFDGDQYVAGGSCSYLVAQAERSGLEHFAVVLRMEGARVASVVAVALERYNIMIRRAAPRKIRVNGEDFTLPLEIPDGLIWAYQDGITTVLQTGFGLKVLFSSNGPLWLVVPSRYRSATSGLCGNFNGLYSDDRRLRSGAPASSLAAFLSSWAEEGEGAACDHGCADHCPFCDVALGLGDIIQQKCGLLSTVDGPFGRCRAVLESAQFFPFCVDALCKTSGDLCLILEAYAMACRSRGGVPGPWRANASCPLTCPDRSSVSPCVASSSSSCSEVLSPPRGPGGCSEGCQCNNGNVFDGGECIPLGNCGCLYQGRYIKMGAKLYNEDCTRRCECHRLGGTLCEPTACSPREICALRDGVRGCHPREQGCQLLGGSGLRSFDGRQLTLTPGAPYELSSLCDPTSDKWFRVVACSSSQGQKTRVLRIFLGLSLIRIQDRTVQVNGRRVTLPVSLAAGVSLREDGAGALVVKRGSEIEVQLVPSGDVTVVLSLWYVGKTCGACGNYNGSPLDDLMGSNSWVAKNFTGCDAAV